MSHANPEARSDFTSVHTASGQRRVYVVAGMHRAGTSVVARGLQALGVDLGDRLMSANQKINARGFFEDNDIVKIDDALLEAAGADWKNVALLDSVDWRASAYETSRREARALLASRLERKGQFGFKDPRVPRLIPFWQQVFAELGVVDAYVIAIRHPLSVIESLTVRDHLDIRRSGWLWLTHLVCALRYTADRSRVVVDYDRLLADPDRELARIAAALKLPAPAVDELEAYTRTFLSKELRHAQHATADDIPESLPTIVREAHALTQRLAADDGDPASDHTHSEVARLFARLVELSPLLGYAGAAEGIADRVPQLSGELDWATKSLAKSTQFTADLQRALEESQRFNDSLKEALEEALEESQHYAQSLKSTLERRDEALASAEAYSVDLNATLQRKDEALATAQTYNDDLRATLTRKDSELTEAHGKLQRVEESRVGRFLLRRIERARDGG